MISRRARSSIVQCAVISISIASVDCANGDDAVPQSTASQQQLAPDAAVAFTSTAVVEHVSRCMDELVARFTTGDFSDARNLLLVGRTSEQPNFPSNGANWYWDGVWKTPWAWAIYLAKTNDTSFVSQFFNDNQTQFGPNMMTMMHTDFLAQLDTDGTLKTNFDNDSTGKWILSNYSALIGLAAYKYIATRIGNTTEATWAQGAYTSLHNSLNTVLGNNETANAFNFLPCEVTRPDSANRCNTFNDANWAQAGWSGQNQWDTMLMGGTPLSGRIGDPAQLDNMYTFGFNRLAGRVPFPSLGAFPGFSTGYNTAYSEGGLFGTQFRDLAITSYAWQIQNTTAARTRGGRPTAAGRARPTSGRAATPARSSAPCRTHGRSRTRCWRSFARSPPRA
jgi:hypothetical protein